MEMKCPRCGKWCSVKLDEFTVLSSRNTPPTLAFKIDFHKYKKNWCAGSQSHMLVDNKTGKLMQ